MTIRSIETWKVYFCCFDPLVVDSQSGNDLAEIEVPLADAFVAVAETERAIRYDHFICGAVEENRFERSVFARFAQVDGNDPATGLGLTNRIQVTVVAPDATRSDALATAISILGRKRGLALVDSIPKTCAIVLTREQGRQHSFVSHRFDRVAPAAP